MTSQYSKDKYDVNEHENVLFQYRSKTLPSLPCSHSRLKTQEFAKTSIKTQVKYFFKNFVGAKSSCFLSSFAENFLPRQKIF